MTSKNHEISELWAEFFVSHALAVKAIEGEMQGRSALSMDAYNVLLAVSRAENGRIRFSDLAESTVYTKSGITRIIRRFEDQGYILREECPEDRRGSFAVLTDKGNKALKETWPHYNKATVKVFADLYSQKEVQTLKILLKRLADHLSSPDVQHITKRRVA